MLTVATDDFARLCDEVRRRTGIDLVQYKRAQMERRVRSYARRRGGTEDLATFARTLSDVAELDAFLDHVTINVSQLWRNPEQWTQLARKVLPQLPTRLRAWSAGCSYGAEALTLAAVVRAEGKQAQIDGTDVDPRIIARAKTGRFTAADVRDAPKPLLKQWFAADGDVWQADRRLLADCRFAAGDLLRIPARTSRYDLVLCRNTVIYFTDEVRDALHGRLVESLRPGGFLVVGATERVADPRGLGLDPVLPFTYRKL